MTYKQQYFTYDETITAGDDDNHITLSITSKGKEAPYANISSSSSKYSTVSVPLSLFADCYDSHLLTFTYVCDDLGETITLARMGVQWGVTQSWGKDSVTTIIHHKDMLKLMQHCSRKFKIKDSFNKPKPLSKKFYRLLTKVFNAPRNLLNW